MTQIKNASYIVISHVSPKNKHAILLKETAIEMSKSIIYAKRNNTLMFKKLLSKSKESLQKYKFWHNESIVIIYNKLCSIDLGTSTFDMLNDFKKEIILDYTEIMKKINSYFTYPISITEIINLG